MLATLIQPKSANKLLTDLTIDSRDLKQGLVHCSCAFRAVLIASIIHACTFPSICQIHRSIFFFFSLGRPTNRPVRTSSGDRNDETHLFSSSFPASEISSRVWLIDLAAIKLISGEQLHQGHNRVPRYQYNVVSLYANFSE